MLKHFKLKYLKISKYDKFEYENIDIKNNITGGIQTISKWNFR